MAFTATCTTFTTCGFSSAGTVDPNGRSTSWSFDYRKVGAASWTAVPGGGADGSDPVPVSSKIGGLAADSDYEIRLRASNDLGDSAVSPPPYQQLTTDPSVAPTAVTTSAGQVTDTRARLNGTVRTGFAETSYWFEWGTQDCAAHACASVPLGRDGAAGAGPGVVHVSRQLTGLQPQTTYHYRLVAENFRGSHAGEDRTFTTRQPDSDCPNAGRIGVGFLPACRAWELVSTPDKQGLDVVLAEMRARGEKV